MYRVALCLALVGLGGCSSQEVPEPSVGMANPASVYCLELGGTLELFKEEAGEYALCRLPSGELIEEWALYRRDHTSVSTAEE